MSIASAIQAKQQQVADSYTAVSNKGGTLPQTQNLTNLATAISSIPSGGGGGSKFGATINTFLGNVNASGVLQQPTEQSDLVFTGVKDVASNVLNYKFTYNKVKSASFPDLTTISGSSACGNAFYFCNALTSVSFPNLTTISGSYACQLMFSYCSSLTDVYFSALTTSSFGSYVNQFSGIMQSTGTSKTHTLHFPSNLESTISGLSGYPLFGGTSGYVVCAFDLPATS